MAANRVPKPAQASHPRPTVAVGETVELVFAGDHVRLAGQIDYPRLPRPQEGFPLLFILHHAGCDNRDWYWPFAELAIESGYAVFRWDKRGTGRSGAGGRGSTTQDAANAYEIALEQPRINRKRTVILAQGAGTGLLGSAYGLFARIYPPHAIVLASNMLDEQEALAIDAPLHVLMGDLDWNPWQKYAEAVSATHNLTYRNDSTFAVAAGADSTLMNKQGDSHYLNANARAIIQSWLEQLCPPSVSI